MVEAETEEEARRHAEALAEVARSAAEGTGGPFQAPRRGASLL